MFRDRHARRIDRCSVLDFGQKADQLTLRFLFGSFHRYVARLPLARCRITRAGCEFESPTMRTATCNVSCHRRDSFHSEMVSVAMAWASSAIFWSVFPYSVADISRGGSAP